MNKFDEYRQFADSTNRLADQRQAATHIYMAVNSAIFTALTFLLKYAANVQQLDLFLISLPLFAIGLTACVIWSSVIKQYRRLIGWRYEQLIELEKVIPECHGMYQKEWTRFFAHENGRFGFSRLEILLPRLFMGLYVAYAIGSWVLVIRAG
jgi:hypothetical protein